MDSLVDWSLTSLRESLRSLPDKHKMRTLQKVKIWNSKPVLSERFHGFKMQSTAASQAPVWTASKPSPHPRAEPGFDQSAMWSFRKNQRQHHEISIEKALMDQHVSKIKGRFLVSGKKRNQPIFVDSPRLGPFRCHLGFQGLRLRGLVSGFTSDPSSREDFFFANENHT